MSQTARVFGQRAQIDIQRRIAAHAGAGGIDHQRGVARDILPVVQRTGMHRRLDLRRQRGGQGLGAVQIAIEQMNARARPAFPAPGWRRAPRRPRPAAPRFCRSMSPIVSRKDSASPMAVGVAAFDFSVAEDQQIGRARRLRRRIHAVRHGEGGFLVRHRDVHAREIRRGAPRRSRRRNPRVPPPAAPWRRRCHAPPANGHAAPATANG